MILRMSPVFMLMVLSILTKVSEAKNSVNICDFSPQSESNLLPPLPYICFCKKRGSQLPNAMCILRCEQRQQGNEGSSKVTTSSG